MQCLQTAILAAVLASSAAAQGVVFNPSNTPGTGQANAFPFGLHSEWRFSFIIDRSVLPRQKLRITDLAFVPTFISTTNFTATQFQVRMGHTTVSAYSSVTPPAFDTVLGPAPTIVYDGPFTWQFALDTWSPIGLQCGFGYDGVRSICCEIRYWTTVLSAVSVRTDPSIKRAFTNIAYTPNPYTEANWVTPIPGESLGPKHALLYQSKNILIAADRVALGNSAAIGIFGGAAGSASPTRTSTSSAARWRRSRRSPASTAARRTPPRWAARPWCRRWWAPVRSSP